MTSERIAPRVENAPGLIWRYRPDGTWLALWHARTDLIARGWTTKSIKLWRGKEPSATQRAYMADTCQRLQSEMLVWGRGSIPALLKFDGTLGGLITCYQNDVDSPYRKLRYRIRLNHDRLMLRLTVEHGETKLCDINARMLLAWHKVWLEGDRISMAHAFIGKIRALLSFGATLLEDPDCERLCSVMHKMRFQMAKPRTERMTADQAVAIRAAAHANGWHSIALAQAIQFELALRQKDVIGEWVPLSEPGTSDIIDGNLKWLRGLRWSEIDSNLILRHTTSKRDKDIEVDFRLAPMVMEEFGRIGPLPTQGPVVISEYNGMPYEASEFRRKWRLMADAAGVPKSIRNMDSRAGGITEATDAGADLESVRHMATHSDIAMTQKYSRGSAEKVAKVMRQRTAHRNKPRTG